MDTPRYLRVALNRPLHQLFDYLAPADTECWPGQRVHLRFGRTRAVGVVIATADVPQIDPERIRPIDAVIDAEPVFPADLLALLTFMADYYHHPLGEVLFQALPPPLRLGKPLPSLPTPRACWRLTDADQPAAAAPRIRLGHRQNKVLACFAASARPLGLTELNTVLTPPVRAAEIERLIQLGLVELSPAEEDVVLNRKPESQPGSRPESEPDTAAEPAAEPVARGSRAEALHIDPDTPGLGVMPHADPNTPGPQAEKPLLQLTPEQQQVVSAVSARLRQRGVFLLAGVTGSGKTEVYLALAALLLEQDGQVLLLVPEIALTPQTLRRLQQHFPSDVVALHSGMATGERMRAWDMARRGLRRLILGTRSALLAPLPRLGLIIVDEEHDTAYKQQDGLRYHARDMAIMRGHLEQIPVLLGSATPTLESLENVARGRFQPLYLHSRPDGSLPPPIQFIDTRLHRPDEGLTKPLLDGLQRVLINQQQCFILLNRRGFARVLACDQCGWMAGCPHCDAQLTVHLAQRQALCHLCGYQTPLLAACPHCAHPLGHRGIGTQRLEQALQKHFPDVPVLRLDRDSTRLRGELERTLAQIRELSAGIVVGTQMLAKGHDFPKVGLVGVIDVDQGLFSPDIRAAEHTAQLVLQAAGRAARAGAPGEVWVQTSHPEHPLMQALRGGDYAAMTEQLLAERKRGNLPPYGFMALVRIEAAAAATAATYAERLAATLRQRDRAVRVLGPAPAPRHRVNQRYREQILLRSNSRPALQKFLRQVREYLEQNSPSSGVRVAIDVDPLTLS